MSEKHEFKAESRRLLDLMINSIYTNREIFLRELISNASDAIDKLRFLAVSYGSLNINTANFNITLTLDKDNRLLTVSDNGIGMNAQELADNLGVIAASGTKAFRENNDRTEDLIGQFGVGFYSAFMVADHITVISRKFDSDTAYCWESDGVDGFTVEPADRAETGTDIILHIRPEKENANGSKPEGESVEGTDEYNRYLREYPIYKLVRKYSDYIRYPIRMLMPHPVVTNEAEIEAAKAAAEAVEAEAKRRATEAAEDEATKHATEAAEDEATKHATEATEGSPAEDTLPKIEIPEPIYEEAFEYETLNSMIPLWHRSRSEVTEEQYIEFYKEHFSDETDPMSVLPIFVEGNISYRALLFIPSHPSKNYSEDDYKYGLELYSSNVLIMKDCRELLPEEFNFVCGVVDSQDLSLNISREMLQQNSDLHSISVSISKKIRQELLKLLKNDREKYQAFYKHFGHHIKVCAMDDYGAKKDSLGELLLFYSGREKKLITLGEYVDAMPEEQKYIYYASGSSLEAVERLPQTDYVLNGHSMDVLYFVDKADEFVSDMFHDYRGKHFRSIIENDPELESDTTQKDGALFKETLAFIRETLGPDIDDVRATNRLNMHPVCLSSGTGVTFEMEKYFKALHKDAPIRAKRILELNVHHPAFMALDSARIEDPERARTYCKILLNQAKLIAGLGIEDPSGYTDLLVSLWQ